jgi:hypothetical protein
MNIDYALAFSGSKGDQVSFATVREQRTDRDLDHPGLIRHEAADRIGLVCQFADRGRYWFL